MQSLIVRHRKRSGFTLVELLVAITLLSAMLSLTGATFYLLMRSEKLVTQSLVTERSISRLAIQFRDDVHQSVSSDVIPESSNVADDMTLHREDGHHIHYRVTKEGLARLVVEGATTVAREDYRLPDCRVHFTSSRDAEALMRTLVIERPSAMMTQNPHAPRPLRSLKIEAYLNRQKQILHGVG